MTPVLLTVAQLCEKNPAFTHGGERWKIFNSKTNGMDDIGVTVRIGRKVYINQSRYFLWVELQNTGELDAVVKLLKETKMSPEDAVAQFRQCGGAAA